MPASTLDTLQFYHSLKTSPAEKVTPAALLSALTTSHPVEFHSSQLNHHFNLQLAGCLQTEWYRSRNSSRQVIAPGHVSLNVASEPFRCRVEPASNTLAFHLVLPVQWMERLRQEHCDQFRSSGQRELVPVLGSWAPELQLPARRLAEELQADKFPLRLRMDELFVELGLKLWRAAWPQAGIRSKERMSAAGLQKVLDYLHAHLATDLSLELLAQVAGLSSWHFCRAFRASVGVSPWQYLKEVRLAEARQLLIHTDVPITDLGLRLGFSTPSHFAAAFRTAYGLSPSRFRTSLR